MRLVHTPLMLHLVQQRELDTKWVGLVGCPPTQAPSLYQCTSPTTMGQCAECILLCIGPLLWRFTCRLEGKLDSSCCCYDDAL